jgi:hypothetical protein
MPGVGAIGNNSSTSRSGGNEGIGNPASPGPNTSICRVGQNPNSMLAKSMT